MDTETVFRDFTGAVIGIVVKGVVFNGEHRKLGFIDERGTFDERGVRVSATSRPTLLLGLAAGAALCGRASYHRDGS